MNMAKTAQSAAGPLNATFCEQAFKLILDEGGKHCHVCGEIFHGATVVDRCLAWEVLMLPACQIARKDNSGTELQVTTHFCLPWETELCKSDGDNINCHT